MSALSGGASRSLTGRPFKGSAPAERAPATISLTPTLTATSMKREMLLCSLLVIVFAAPAAAQITFDASDLESLRGTHVQTNVHLMDAGGYPALSAILDAKGANQTYNFTPFTYTLTGVEYDVLPSAAGTPGEADPLFGSANYVQKQNTGGGFYAYYDLSGAGFYLLGSIFVEGADANGNGILDQSIQRNAPADPTYEFPLTEGSAWSREVVSTVEGFGSSSQTTSTVDFAVEGWGTLRTPAGSAPALRLRKTLAVRGDGIQGYTTTSYLFITRRMMGASIILDAQGQVLAASYNDDGKGTTAAEEPPLYGFRLDQNQPNPFSSATRITFALEQPGHATLRVFDVMGREVGRLVDDDLPAGNHATSFRNDALAAGVYFYRLQVGERTSVRPLILQR